MAKTKYLHFVEPKMNLTAVIGGRIKFRAANLFGT